MEEILTLASALLASLSGGTPYPSVSTDNPFLGYYYVIEEVEEESWYEIPYEMEDDFISMGREVSMSVSYSPSQGIIRTYRSKATPSLGKVTGIRPIYASLDSLIFLVGELEKEADQLSYENSQIIDPDTGEPVSNSLSSESDIINAVLSYIRSVNIKYSSGYQYLGFNTFNLVCGSSNNQFNQRIASSSRHLFRFPDFFGRLVSEDKYNPAQCGEVTQSESIQEIGWEINIYDPIEPTVNLGYYNGSGIFIPVTVHPRLDIPHMFVGIDATYDHTGSTFHLPDIASWGGDLQTSYLAALENYWDFNFAGSGNIFKSVLYSTDLAFDINDFVSDVDAINIGERYINSLNKRPSEALASYYSPKPLFSRFRYDQFPGNVLESVNENVSTDQIWTSFEDHVYKDMRLKKDENGEYVNVSTSFLSHPEHFFIKNDPASNAEKRKKFAQSFLKYIKSQSIYGVGSC